MHLRSVFHHRLTQQHNSLQISELALKADLKNLYRQSNFLENIYTQVYCEVAKMKKIQFQETGRKPRLKSKDPEANGH